MVLSPLMFILYSDVLRSVVPETVKVANVTDDVSFISSQYIKHVAQNELQIAITSFAKWRTSKKIVLNADKCEETFSPINAQEANFSTRNHCQQHQPSAKSAVTPDRLLTFGPHIQGFSTKAAVRCRVHASLTSKEGGG